MTFYFAAFALERFAYMPNYTLGKLYGPAGVEVYTLERPWRDNQPYVSCIPCGLYSLRQGTFLRGGGVPNLEFVDSETLPRTHIEIHPANTVDELHGCIAPGLSYSHEGADVYLHDSATALGRIMQSLDDGGYKYLSIHIHNTHKGQLS